MSFTKKHFELLEFINKEKTLDDIASITKESKRIIRYRIETLNQELKQDFKVEIIKKKINWRGNLKENLKENFIEFEKLSYSYDQDERVTLIIIKTLILKERFLLSEISEFLDITKPTLRNDLKKLKERLEEFDIYLVQNGGALYSYTYNEIDLRFFITSFLYNFFDFENSIHNIPLKRNNFFNEKVANMINKIFKNDFYDYRMKCLKLNEQLETSFSDEAINMFSIFISLNRDFSIMLNKNINFYKSTEEYLVFSDYFPEIEENYRILFTDYLLGVSYNRNNSFLKYQDWVNIEVEVYKSVKKFSQLTETELYKHKHLINEIINHIKPMIYRLNKKISLENSIYEEVFEKYKNTFHLTKLCFQNLESLLKIKITNEELAFLALRFQLSLKNNHLNKVKNLAVVCNFGMLTSKFLKERIKEVFEVDSIKTFSLNEFITLNSYNFDLVVSTVDIKTYNLEIPIIKVHPLLLEEDVSILKDMNLSTIKSKINLKVFINTLKKYSTIHREEELLSELNNNFDSFFENREIKKNSFNKFIEKELIIGSSTLDWKEAIKTSGKLLETKEYISNSYIYDLIYSSEKNNPNLFIGKNTIFPHAANNSNVFDTKFSILKLEAPILFNGSLIKFIICFCSDGKEDYLDTLFKLMELFGNEKEEEKILSLSTDEIYYYLKYKLCED